MRGLKVWRKSHLYWKHAGFTERVEIFAELRQRSEQNGREYQYKRISYPTFGRMVDLPGDPPIKTGIDDLDMFGQP